MSDKRTVSSLCRRYSWVKNSLLCEIVVVEGKIIVVGSFKYSPFSSEKGSGIYPLVQNGEESSAKMPSQAPPTTPGRPNKFSARTTRLISRHIADLHSDSLREQVYKISEILANELQTSVRDAELSSIFGRKWSWSRGIICEYLY
jgi:hypothetical protein